MSGPYYHSPASMFSGLAPVANPSFSGVVQIAAGTAAAPALTPENDADTGFFSPSPNHLALSTGGVERLRVAADGSLRIVSGSDISRASSFAGNGIASLRYDDNGTPENLNLRNYGVGNANQGLAISWHLGTGGILGAQAGRLAVRSSDTWAALGNRQAHLVIHVARDGTLIERLRIESDGTLTLGGGPGTESLRTVTPSNCVNAVQVSGAVTGSGVSVAARGADANIDLALSAKGTGRLRFGDFTAGSGAITGHIEIKDAAGTIRRLAVIA